jgi:hypothetical protein
MQTEEKELWSFPILIKFLSFYSNTGLVRSGLSKSTFRTLSLLEVLTGTTPRCESLTLEFSDWLKLLTESISEVTFIRKVTLELLPMLIATQT